MGPDPFSNGFLMDKKQGWAWRNLSVNNIIVVFEKKKVKIHHLSVSLAHGFVETLVRVDGRLEFGDVAWRVAYVARLAPGGCAFHVLKTRVFTLTETYLTNEPLGLNTNRTCKVCAGKFKLCYEKFRADERIFLDFHWHLCIGENKKPGTKES